MSHKINKLSTQQFCSFCGSRSPYTEITITWSSALIPLSGLQYDRSFLYFNYKHDQWLSTFNKVIVTLSWGNTDSGYLRYRSNSFDNWGSIKNVNSTEWTGFKIPLSEFEIVNNSFDVSSLYGASIFTLGQESADIFTVEVKDLYIEYGDDLVMTNDQSFSIVGSGGGDAIQLEPEFDMKKSFKKIESRQRLWNGDLYSYLFGEYQSVRFGAKYVPSSAAMAVNSLWRNNTPCVFFSANSYSAEIIDVRLSGSTLPFSKLQQPYIDLYDGKIEMETFD